MNGEHVVAFLNHLARERNVAASTQNQALSALLFLYRGSIEALPWLDGLERARRPARLPSVLTPEEVQRLLGCTRATKWLMASLLYGAGLRLRESRGGASAFRDAGPMKLCSPVQRTAHALAALVEHVRVDHRRRNVRMPEQLLDAADVVAGSKAGILIDIKILERQSGLCWLLEGL